jgi:hypothetical protein
MRARGKYHATPTSAARAWTATSETALKGGPSAEKSQRQTTSPKIDNPAALKTADQARDVRHLWAAALVCMLYLVLVRSLSSLAAKAS